MIVNMKLSATLLLLALCASDAARASNRRRAQDDVAAVAAAPADVEIVSDAGQKSPFGTSKKEDGVAIITNLYHKCYYQFDDEDYTLIGKSESAMTCANDICNLDFLGNTESSGLYTTTNRIVGLNLRPDPFRSQNDQLIGEFRVGCADSDHWNAAFTCPAGYYVQELLIKQRSNCGGSTGNTCKNEMVCNKNVYANSSNKVDRRVCTEFINDPTTGITLGKVGPKTGQSVLYTLKCREL